MHITLPSFVLHIPSNQSSFCERHDTQITPNLFQFDPFLYYHYSSLSIFQVMLSKRFILQNSVLNLCSIFRATCPTHRTLTLCSRTRRFNSAEHDPVHTSQPISMRSSLMLSLYLLRIRSNPPIFNLLLLCLSAPTKLGDLYLGSQQFKSDGSNNVSNALIFALLIESRWNDKLQFEQ
jgi:hypothetical protein